MINFPILKHYYFQLVTVTWKDLRITLVTKMVNATANVTSEERNVMNVHFNTLDSPAVNVSFTYYEVLKLFVNSEIIF